MPYRFAWQAVADHAAETGVPGAVAFEEARLYAREIVPSFSATLYFGVATRLARWISRGLYRVRIGRVDPALNGQLDRKATVIFVMNHRSNMDYVLVTWLVANRSALSYAVGEWARIWPFSRMASAPVSGATTSPRRAPPRASSTMPDTMNTTPSTGAGMPVVCPLSCARKRTPATVPTSVELTDTRATLPDAGIVPKPSTVRAWGVRLTNFT
jgi:hypothetical protein